MKDINKEIERTFEVLNNIKEVESPKEIYSGVLNKLSLEEKSGFSITPVLRWAAVALLVMMNTVSYITFLNEDASEANAMVDSEIEIEALVSEYQIADFSYNDY
jgi:hypothetical protein